MLSNYFKSFLLLLFSLVIINLYYFGFGHSESFNLNYLYYFLSIFLVIGVYNFFIFYFNKDGKIKISLFNVIFFFIINLFILSVFLFKFNSLALSSSFIVFGKVFLYSLLPISTFLITTSFGKKLTNKLDFVKNYSPSFNFVLSLNIGFISFLTLVILGSFLGFYNLYFIFFIFLGFLVFSIKDFIKLTKTFWEYKLEFSLKRKNLFYFFSSQFFYLVACIVLSIGLISILRPYPIGWDDLGVYMNYPKQLAEAGTMIGLGGMQAWQMFTGIGYMISGAPVFAFFLNISGSFLSFIVLIIIISDLLQNNFEKHHKKPFLPLPLMFSTLFISLPMVVFQMAKDMKLDLGLFFISISSIYLAFSYILRFKEVKHHKKTDMILVFIIGILSGFAFSIKFTSLILIVSILGLFSFFRLGILGLFSFFFVFLGIFTYGNLWKMMNVIVNPTNIENFNLIYGGGFFILGIILFVFSLFSLKIKEKREKEKSKNGEVLEEEVKVSIKSGKTSLFFQEISLFLIGIFFILSPWLGKNIYETYPNLTISGFLSGKGEHYNLDLEKIYSKEEILEIKQKYEKERKKENLVTTNEDLLRYLGYDSGILNYVFLPWNLTMQKNQGGEFTDISFVFLALIPLIFIFLPYRNKYFFIFFIFLVFIPLLIVQKEKPIFIENKYSYNVSKEKFSNIFIRDNNYLNKLYYININNYLGKNGESKKAFYNELVDKISNKDFSKNVNSFSGLTLKQSDISLLEKISDSYNKYIAFRASDVKQLEKNLLSLEKNLQNDILNLWNKNRTLRGKIIDFFAKINIPIGYIYIFGFFIFLLLFLLLSLKKSKQTYLFKLNLVFTTFYVFLWTISSFGIVWYGISMYFSFILMIVFSSFYFSYIDKNDEKVERIFKIITSIILFFIVFSYSVFSVIPHSFNNLKSTGYLEYKNGKVLYPSAVFDYHRTYFQIFSRLNIKEDKQKEFINDKVSSNVLKELKRYSDLSRIDEVIIILKQFKNQLSGKRLSVEELIFKKDLENSLDNLYHGIINPEKKYRNTGYIYRSGTFLKYYVSDNYKRFLEDNLLFTFNDYIYSENTEETISRFKKLGIKYLIIDLNSATIDKSKTHDLTERYEKILKTISSPKLELISTDSFCLMVGLEYYRKTLDIEKYMFISGGNYKGYKNGKQISKKSKLDYCENYINDLVKTDSINENNFYFLNGFKNLSSQYIKNNIKRSSYAVFKIKE